jgi:large subunit ribosomal protein L13
MRASLTTVSAVFEGVSHPYKQNIIKDYTRPSIAQQPEVKVAFAQQQKQQ